MGEVGEVSEPQMPRLAATTPAPEGRKGHEHDHRRQAGEPRQAAQGPSAAAPIARSE